MDQSVARRFRRNFAIPTALICHRLALYLAEHDLHWQALTLVKAIGRKVKDGKRVNASTAMSELFARLHQTGFADRVQRTSAEHHLCLSFQVPAMRLPLFLHAVGCALQAS